MKRIVSSIVTCMLLVLSAQGLRAQDQTFVVTVYGSLLMPLGQFAEQIGTTADLTRRLGFDYGEKVGLAKTGFGGGVEVSTKVHGNHVSWILSGKFLSSPTDVSGITSKFKHDFGDSLDVSFNNGSWTNIPIFTGFKFDYDLVEGISLYGTIQGGVNVTQQAPRKAYVEKTVVEETNFKFMADFGFEAGVGVELLKRFNVGVRYLNLGSPRYEGTRKLNVTYFPAVPRREMSIDGDERPVSMVIVVLGFQL